MKKLIIILVVALLSATQIKAEHIRKEVSVTEVFTKIMVTSNIKLIVTDQGEVGKIVVEGAGKDVESVVINVKKGVLSIHRKGIFSPNGRVYVHINTVTMRQIQARDEAFVYVANLKAVDLLELKAVEDARINIKTNASHVIATVSDNARIKIEGKFTEKHNMVAATDLRKTVYLK
jgi:Putative auto-transporter adhesin, head GIN domain